MARQLGTDEPMQIMSNQPPERTSCESPGKKNANQLAICNVRLNDAALYKWWCRTGRVCYGPECRV